MDYFLDTNIEIGYVFCTDPWNDESVSLFDKENNNYHYSHCVDKEFNFKYNSILKEQKNFLFSLRKDLSLELPSKVLSLKTLKLKSSIVQLKRDFDDNKKENIVEVLWKFSKSKHVFDNELNIAVCTVNDLLIYIGKFIRVFERKLLTRRLDFENNVIFHAKRDEEYVEVNEKLLFDAGVHYPDNCIILDAHHLSLTEDIVLEFISADNNMIKNVIIIIDLLNIKKFHYLRNFVDNFAY